VERVVSECLGAKFSSAARPLTGREGDLIGAPQLPQDGRLTPDTPRGSLRTVHNEMINVMFVTPITGR